MGGRWKWFLRPGKVALDLTGQAVPDGDVPGRFRRQVIEHLVPQARVTSRCDGALVYERPEERPASPGRNQRAGRYDADRFGERNQGRFETQAASAPSGGEPVEAMPPAELLATAAQLERANRLADSHWRSPTEDPRSRRCPACRADGTCPRAAWADAILMRCLRSYLR
ncbi:hypothetical protein KIF24_13415 [Micromonospora sp. Llam7]|uniref:hypothetical protein n=1 Tax=Micromonospora tarapacensis TaxID=2835305 RepID=UPI001C83494A|nr:hypothetical protein [Micromonospora tarapacensis]MBX7266929.1 hypothetical protein [Micromonospora tarapacensis]